MLTLSKTALKSGVEWIEKPIPVPHNDEVLIKILYVSVCGTDVHLYEWNEWAQNRVKKPMTMGHEFVGTIVQCGPKVKHRKVGELVSAETHIVCGTCEFCLSNQKHICENTEVIGVDRDGAFAQYICIPEENAWLNSPDIPVHYLSVQEPLGNAVHTLMAQPIEGKTVAILGVGPIGILAVDAAKAMGAKTVIAIDVVEYRLNLAKQVGADAIIFANKENIDKRIRELCGKNGVDVICEMSGNIHALKQAFTYVKPGGHISILGIPNQDLSFDVASSIVFKGIHVHGITGRHMFETWDVVKSLVDNKKLHLDQIITHVLDWTQIHEAMELMHKGQCGKIVLKVNHDETL